MFDKVSDCECTYKRSYNNGKYDNYDSNHNAVFTLSIILGNYY